MIEWDRVWKEYWNGDSEKDSQQNAVIEVEKQLKGNARGSLGVATCFACNECAFNESGEPFGCGDEDVLIKRGIIRIDPKFFEIVCDDFLTHEEQAEPPEQDDIDD